jgi:hypothetical protein
MANNFQRIGSVGNTQVGRDFEEAARLPRSLQKRMMSQTIRK